MEAAMLLALMTLTFLLGFFIGRISRSGRKGGGE